MLLLENGSVKHTKKRAKFQCDEYFYLEGVKSLTCKDGSWSGIVGLAYQCDGVLF